MDATTFTKKLSVIHAQRLLLDQKEANLLKEFSKSNKPQKEDKNKESKAKAQEYFAKRFYLNQQDVTEKTFKSK